MNNKPVAWIDKINTFVLNKDYKQLSKNLQNGMIPLYIHPAKKLTISDKDILKIIHDKFTKFGFEADYIVEDTELIDFVRAILRKAQEK